MTFDIKADNRNSEWLLYVHLFGSLSTCSSGSGKISAKSKLQRQ